MNTELATPEPQRSIMHEYVCPKCTHRRQQVFVADESSSSCHQVPVRYMNAEGREVKPMTIIHRMTASSAAEFTFLLPHNDPL